MGDIFQSLGQVAKPRSSTSRRTHLNWLSQSPSPSSYELAQRLQSQRSLLRGGSGVFVGFGPRRDRLLLVGDGPLLVLLGSPRADLAIFSLCSASAFCWLIRTAETGPPTASEISNSNTAALSTATRGFRWHQRHSLPAPPRAGQKIGSPLMKRCKSSSSAAAVT